MVGLVNNATQGANAVNPFKKRVEEQNRQQDDKRTDQSRDSRAVAKTAQSDTDERKAPVQAARADGDDRAPRRQQRGSLVDITV